MTNDTGPKPSRVKKSETLEVRIPYETKQAFLTACREDGTTASEVVRDKVQDYLDARERPSLNEEKRTLVMKLPQPVRRYGLRVAAGGIVAVGLTSLAVLPSAANPDFRAQFGRLDANGDGVLSVEEFLGPAAAGAATTEARNVVIQSRITSSPDDVNPEISITPEIKRDAFAFWLPEELRGDSNTAAQQQTHEYKFIGRSEVKKDEPGGSPPGVRTFSLEKTFSLEDIRKEEFASIDTNGDGRISLQEYQVRQTAMLTHGFEVLDANGDKGLSEEEFAKIVAPPMVRVNLSSTGIPDMPEIPKVEVEAGVSPEAIKAAFTRLDANRDGKLSLQEYLPAS